MDNSSVLTSPMLGMSYRWKLFTAAGLELIMDEPESRLLPLYRPSAGTAGITHHYWFNEPIIFHALPLASA